jgi:hypothetical protein
LGLEKETLHSDYANPFMAKTTMDYLEKESLVSQSSTQYRQFQNSVERNVQIFVKKASAILHGQLWLRSDAWAKAVKHIADLDNLMPK